MGSEVGTGSEAVDDVEHAGWQSGVEERLGRTVSHQWTHRRRLEHDGVAGGKGRPDLAASEVEWEVPWGDDGDDTHRVEHRVDDRCVIAGKRGAGEPVGRAGVEVEVLQGAERSLRASASGLPSSATISAAMPSARSASNRPARLQRLGALRRRRPPPAGETADRRGDGGSDVVCRRFRSRRDDHRVGWVAPLEHGAVGRRQPISIDQVENVCGHRRTRSVTASD